MSATTGETEIIEIDKSTINKYEQNRNYDPKTNTITITYGPTPPNIETNFTPPIIKTHYTEDDKKTLKFAEELKAEREAKKGGRRRKSKRKKSRRRKSKRRSYRRR
jgi:hypothetical protein